jgi:hypothetical protein
MANRGVRIKPEAMRRLVWSAPDSKIVPFCSLCQAHIPNDTVPLMFWDAKGACAQLCEECIEKALELT